MVVDTEIAAGTEIAVAVRHIARTVPGMRGLGRRVDRCSAASRPGYSLYLVAAEYSLYTLHRMG